MGPECVWVTWGTCAQLCEGLDVTLRTVREHAKQEWQNRGEGARAEQSVSFMAQVTATGQAGARGVRVEPGKVYKTLVMDSISLKSGGEVRDEAIKLHGVNVESP